MTIDDVLTAAPVIPVLVLDDRLDPAALAHTLVEAGLPVLEVTLRTPNALDAIRAMARVPGAIVGAGTVLDPEQLGRAQDAGARFIVSPGLSERLTRAVLDSGLAFLSGVATASEILHGLELGLTRFKFFPAEAAGGLKALDALSGPFAAARFCPTGGIRRETAPAWLAHRAVSCVGGSWIVPAGEGDLAVVAARARDAASLRQP